MLSFNEIQKVCYCRFHTAIKKICLSDDVNYFLEEGNSSYKIYIFSPNVYKIITKKMFNQDEGKIECAVGNREICVWQSKKAEIVLILFLTSGFAAFICLWLLVLPNSNN